MRKWSLRYQLLLLVVILGGATGACAALAVSATSPTPATVGSVTAATGGNLTLEDAVAKVQSATHGRILRADKRQFGDSLEYRIKILTPDGRVRVISVPAHPTTGATENEETH